MGLFVLQQILGYSPDRRNWEFLPDMVRSRAYRSQSSSPHFSDGRMQREPVAETIARGYMPFDYGTSVQESERSGRELQSPFDARQPAELERGEAIWKTYCQVCHGTEGEGDGPVTRRGYPPPPSLLSGRVEAMKEGQIFHIITFGNGNMPSYGSQIDRRDRWQVVQHLRRLQENQQ